jgi:ferritin-like metal-binding protein YciE
LNEKLVQYFNEALAMENAAVERVQMRIKDTIIEQTREQLQYHLEQTFDQQARLRSIIEQLGGTPTTMKSSLPKLVPMNFDTLSNSIKETAKSIVDSSSKDALDAEKELIESKEDAIIESAEVVSYKNLMQISEETGLQEAVQQLNKSLQEENDMVNFIMENAPIVIRLLLPRIAKIEDLKAGGGQKRVTQA